MTAREATASEHRRAALPAHDTARAEPRPEERSERGAEQMRTREATASEHRRAALPAHRTARAEPRPEERSERGAEQ